MATANIARRLFQKKSHLVKISSIWAQRSICTTAGLPAAWNRDWKPGPYPQTEEERRAAAEKYGLRVEDYQPYDPDIEPGYGDYPQIKWVGAEGRDPYEDFDYPHLGYNYKETLHIRADHSTGDRYNPEYEKTTYYSQTFMISTLCIIYFGGMALHWLCEVYDIKWHMPVMPKQYPDHLWIQRGKDPEKMPKVVHYTFEPADS